MGTTLMAFARKKREMFLLFTCIITHCIFCSSYLMNGKQNEPDEGSGRRRIGN